MRYKLMFKIQKDYGTYANFCECVGITYQNLNCVLSGKGNGSYKFWEMIKKQLNIPDEEIESYRKNEEKPKEEKE